MFLTLLEKWWSVNDPVPENADVVVPVSYGATPTRTTNGSKSICNQSNLILDSNPGAKVAYGIFTYSPEPRIEWVEKHHIFPQGLCVGKVASTIEEAEKIKEILPTDLQRSTIVVVTGSCHSRTARWVWKNVFPKANIVISSVPIGWEIDKISPMKLARSKWKWFWVNVARHIVFRVCGFEMVRRWKLHQPIARVE